MISLKLALSGVAAGLVLVTALALVLPALAPDPEGHRTLVSDAPAGPAKGMDWLTIEDDRSPSEWLAERARARGQGPDEAGFAALLEALAPVYQETPRMIANRVAQIEDELSGDPDAATLLADFNWVTDRPRVLGAEVQHYLVLRRRGLGHRAALDRLRDGGSGDDGLSDDGPGK